MARAWLEAAGLTARESMASRARNSTARSTSEDMVWPPSGRSAVVLEMASRTPRREGACGRAHVVLDEAGGAGGVEEDGEGQVGGGLGGGDGVEGEAGLRGEGFAGAGEAQGRGGRMARSDSGRVRVSGERVLRTAVRAFFCSSGETILVMSWPSPRRL